MILSKVVEIKWNAYNKKEFIEKGYAFTKLGDFFNVRIEDLDEKSCCQVLVKCDICGKESYRRYRDACSRERHSCNNGRCKNELAKEVNLRKYGCECVLSLQDKKEQGMMKKYGVANPGLVPEVVEKRKRTFEKNFATEEARKDLQKRKEDTREHTTGYRSPFHDPTNRHERLAKTIKTKHDKNSIKTSPQQRYLHNILGGELNVPIDTFAIDILVNGIAVEYDGGGHHIYMKIKDADGTREKERENLILSHYKLIRISSKKDLLYSKEEIKVIFNHCVELLRLHDKVVVDVDKNKILYSVFEESINFIPRFINLGDML